MHVDIGSVADPGSGAVVDPAACRDAADAEAAARLDAGKSEQGADEAGEAAVRDALRSRSLHDAPLLYRRGLEVSGHYSCSRLARSGSLVKIPADGQGLPLYERTAPR